MGVQVTYNMKDLIKDNVIEVRLESECYDDKREWYAFVGDTYMGQAVDDVLGTYWFDNKNINFEAVAVLDANEVPFTRGLEMKTNPEFVSFLIHLAEEERGVDIEILGNLLGVDLEQPALDASVSHKGLCRWAKDGLYVDRDYIHLVLAEVRPKVQKHFEAYNDLFRML